jgi:hypothetical protein
MGDFEVAESGRSDAVCEGGVVVRGGDARRRYSGSTSGECGSMGGEAGIRSVALVATQAAGRLIA